MKSIKKIAIVGVGFMGGSLALAVRKRFPKTRVVGFARCRKSYNRLKKLKILDQVHMDLSNVVDDADLVVMGLPVEVIVEYFKNIAPFLKKGTIVFDLGSSKKEIEAAAGKYLPKYISFVGCHPLCGSEKSGAEFSRSDLYKNSLCLITSTNSKATKTVKEFWQKLGSKVHYIDSKSHDKALSAVSHFPHLVSFSYTKFVPKEYLKFAAGSLKDLTRISHSPAYVWADIFISNKANILKDLKEFNKALKRFENALNEGREEVFELIKEVNAKHEVLARQLDVNKKKSGE